MENITVTREMQGDRRGRYVARTEAGEAELTFTRLDNGVVRADHTGVPDALGGRGIGRKLVEALVADARAEGLRIEPRCSYVAAQLQRNPDWADLATG